MTQTWEEFAGVDDSLTWKKLRDLINKMPKELQNQSVVVNDGGSETYASTLVCKDGDAYLRGF